jgi:hypothetical protein
MMIPLCFAEITLHPVSQNFFANFQSQLKKFDDRLGNSIVTLTVPSNSRKPIREEERGAKRTNVPANFLTERDRDLNRCLLSGQNLPERRDLKYVELGPGGLSDSPVESKRCPQGVVHGPRNWDPPLRPQIWARIEGSRLSPECIEELRIYSIRDLRIGFAGAKDELNRNLRLYFPLWNAGTSPRSGRKTIKPKHQAI